MKIGILGTRGIPNQYGGFEQFTAFLAPELVKRGHEVFVYNSSTHPYKEKEWKGVQLIRCKDPERSLGTTGQFIYDRNCNRDARKRKFDVLFHFGYSSDSIGWKGWPKEACNIVNMDGLEWKRTKYSALTRRFLKRAEALAATHADLLIADSLAIQEHLKKTYDKRSVYIPYAATVFSEPDPNAIKELNLDPFQYYLVIARMERENNIEMIIEGYLRSTKKFPLIIIGGTDNKTGRQWKKKYEGKDLRFPGAVYDDKLLNNLRHFSNLYFHGHSVGGTNPSLLEAMACGATIAAHENEFNKAILNSDAFYFSNPADVASVMNRPANEKIEEDYKKQNIEKIKKDFSPEKILSAYEKLISDACQR